MPDYEAIADKIRFGDALVVRNDEWWKDNGREILADALKKLVEVHRLSEDEAKNIVKGVFWAGWSDSNEFGD